MTDTRNRAFATGVFLAPFVVAWYGRSVPAVAGLVDQRKSLPGGDKPNDTVYTFAGFSGLLPKDFPGPTSRVEQLHGNR